MLVTDKKRSPPPHTHTYLNLQESGRFVLAGRLKPQHCSLSQEGGHKRRARKEPMEQHTTNIKWETGRTTEENPSVVVKGYEGFNNHEARRELF